MTTKARDFKTITFFVVLSVLLITTLVFGFKYYQFRDYKNKVAAIAVSNIDFSSIPDGEYYGTHDVNYVKVKVKVTVNSGKVTAIELLKHKHDRGVAAEVIIDSVIEKQRLDVDVVAGATSSSKTILKAIENAVA